MTAENYAITFACYNQLNYTRKCIESLLRNGLSLDRLVVVDNASTDKTLDYLSSLPLGGVIHNKYNLGCGVAWNQGTLALQAEWTVVMNNDVILTHNWLENLIRCAEINNVRIISPAMIEGDLDYDLDGFTLKSMQDMGAVLRENGKHAVCLAIHESVWKEIGYFEPNPRLLGYEDSLFFHAADKAGIRSAITGASWIHHFGSITQTAMKREMGVPLHKVLNDRRYNRNKLGLSWIERKYVRIMKKRQLNLWRNNELATYGMTLHGDRRDGEFKWR